MVSKSGASTNRLMRLRLKKIPAHRALDVQQRTRGTFCVPSQDEPTHPYLSRSWVKVKTFSKKLGQGNKYLFVKANEAARHHQSFDAMTRSSLEKASWTNPSTATRYCMLYQPSQNVRHSSCPPVGISSWLSFASARLANTRRRFLSKRRLRLPLNTIQPPRCRTRTHKKNKLAHRQTCEHAYVYTNAPRPPRIPAKSTRFLQSSVTSDARCS